MVRMCRLYLQHNTGVHIIRVLKSSEHWANIYCTPDPTTWKSDACLGRSQMIQRIITIRIYENKHLRFIILFD